MEKKSQPNCAPKIVGIIPARYGSTRFPGKILATISGKTLIQRTYENAVHSNLFDQVIVATDDTRIFQHLNSFEAQAVMTSIHCQSGTDRLVEVMKAFPALLQSEMIVNIQGDEPCLPSQSIEKVISALKNDPQSVMATAVTKITSQEEAESRSVVKCVFDNNKRALYFSRVLIPAGHTFQWNHAYRHVGIYAYRPDFLLQYASLPQSALQKMEDLEQLKVLENGYKITVAVVDSIPIGVDLPEDIQKVEKWLCKQNTFLSQAESALL